MPLTRANTRTIDRSGGTFLHTSRTNPGKVVPEALPDFLKGDYTEPGPEGRFDCTPHVLKVLEPTWARRPDRHRRRRHPLLRRAPAPRGRAQSSAIPKTMDNDVHGTDYCIGFSTAVTRSVEFIHALRTAAGSHERIAVIELFGRYSGETSLISAYLAGVDRAVISEVDFDVDKLADFLVEDRQAQPQRLRHRHHLRGRQAHRRRDAPERRGRRLRPQEARRHRAFLSQEIERRSGVSTLYQQVAYLMRSGEPDALDRMVATTYGYLATDLLLKKQSGRMVALRDGKYTTVSANVDLRGPQARGRGRAVRHRELPAEGGAPARQADVPVLIRAVRRLSCLLILVAGLAGPATPVAAAAVALERGVVAAPESLASEAGAAILRAGGNAVDAAVAVQFALAVTYPRAGNLGGGGFMLRAHRLGRRDAIDYRETAPAAATRDMYLDATGDGGRRASASTRTAPPACPARSPGCGSRTAASARCPGRGCSSPAIRLAERGLRRPAPAPRPTSPRERRNNFRDYFHGGRRRARCGSPSSPPRCGASPRRARTASTAARPRGSSSRRCAAAAAWSRSRTWRATAPSVRAAHRRALPRPARGLDAAALLRRRRPASSCCSMLEGFEPGARSGRAAPPTCTSWPSWRSASSPTAPSTSATRTS